jgi:hypothetical protein
VGKSFVEKPPQRKLFMYCNLQQNATHAAEKGMVYTNRLGVARKGFPKARLLLFHAPMGCAPSTGVGTSREALTSYQGRTLSGNSQDAPPGSRGEGSILASMAASRIPRWREGLAKGVAIDAGQRSSCWRSATAAGGTETG